MISEGTLNTLEDVLIEVVSDTGHGPWKDKRDFIYNNLSDEGKSALSEFVAWWEGQDIL